MRKQTPRVKLMESMKAYRDKKYEKVAGDWLGYLHRLEKTATTIGATKNLLRQLRGDGIKIVRRADKTTPAAPEIPPEMHRLGLEMAGPGYLDHAKTIYLPRFQKPGPVRGRAKAEFDSKKMTLFNNSALHEYGSRAQRKSIFGEDFQELSNTATHMSPRELLFHEGGHALHHLDDPAAFSPIKLKPQQEAIKKQLTDEKTRSSLPAKSYLKLLDKLSPSSRQMQQIKQHRLGVERVANNNAVNFMREHNVPKSAIESYIRNMEKTYSTYLMAMGTPGGKLWDGSKYFSPTSVDYLSKIPKTAAEDMEWSRQAGGLPEMAGVFDALKAQVPKVQNAAYNFGGKAYDFLTNLNKNKTGGPQIKHLVAGGQIR